MTKLSLFFVRINLLHFVSVAVFRAYGLLKDEINGRFVEKPFR